MYPIRPQLIHGSKVSHCEPSHKQRWPMNKPLFLWLSRIASSCEGAQHLVEHTHDTQPSQSTGLNLWEALDRKAAKVFLHFVIGEFSQWHPCLSFVYKHLILLPLFFFQACTEVARLVKWLRTKVISTNWTVVLLIKELAIQTIIAKKETPCLPLGLSPAGTLIKSSAPQAGLQWRKTTMCAFVQRLYQNLL